MPELLLLRHAKSSWDDAEIDDHDRDLTARGIETATRLGRQLRADDLLPDLVLCSTAVRADRTWALVAAELGREVPLRHLPELYMAMPPRILDIVRSQPDTVRRLALVAHNPGLELALAAFAQSEPVVGERPRKFPPGGLARLRLDTPWREASYGRAELVSFVRPRDLD